MPLRRAAFTLMLLVAGCGSSDLFLVAQPDPVSQIAVQPRTIEVRDVVLPAYAAEADILVQDADGALRPLGALWADDPRGAVTRAIARRLDLGTTATVAPEPWPLFDGPDRSVQVTVERLVARADGMVELSGQFAVISSSGAARDFLRRFAITEPYAGTDPQSVANAVGIALSTLADEIAGSVAR